MGGKERLDGGKERLDGGKERLDGGKGVEACEGTDGVGKEMLTIALRISGVLGV